MEQSSKAKVIGLQQRQLIALLNNKSLDNSFFLLGSENGFLVFIKNAEKHYILETQRKKIRFFKSIKTALEFLTDIGIDNVKVENFGRWVKS